MFVEAGVVPCESSGVILINSEGSKCTVKSYHMCTCHQDFIRERKWCPRGQYMFTYAVYSIYSQIVSLLTLAHLHYKSHVLSITTDHLPKYVVMSQMFECVFLPSMQP